MVHLNEELEEKILFLEWGNWLIILLQDCHFTNAMQQIILEPGWKVLSHVGLFSRPVTFRLLLVLFQAIIHNYSMVTISSRYQLFFRNLWIKPEIVVLWWNIQLKLALGYRKISKIIWWVNINCMNLYG